MSFQLVALTVTDQYWSPRKSASEQGYQDEQDRKTRKKSLSSEHRAESVLANFLSVIMIKNYDDEAVKSSKMFLVSDETELSNSF